MIWSYGKEQEIEKAELDEKAKMFTVRGQAEFEDGSKFGWAQLFVHAGAQKYSKSGLDSAPLLTAPVVFGQFFFHISLLSTLAPGAGKMVAVRTGFAEVKKRGTPPFIGKPHPSSSSRPAVCCAEAETKKKKGKL